MQPPPQTAIPAVARDRGQPVPQRRAVAGRRPGRPEDHGRPVAASRRHLELVLEHVVAHGEQHQVDRSVDVGERRQAGEPLHLGATAG